MTAEGPGLSLAWPRGDGVSESKWMGGREGACRVEEFMQFRHHQGPVVVVVGGGGVAAPLALGDRYRQELRRQNLHP